MTTVLPTAELTLLVGYDKVVQILDPKYYDDRDAALHELFALARLLVTEVLEDLGYSAIEAADSVSALKVLRSDVRIDLLVTDVGLPGGMNGRQMVDAAREDRPALKVLFITGYAENAAIGRTPLERGMHVLTKPFQMDRLASRIKAIIADR